MKEGNELREMFLMEYHNRPMNEEELEEKQKIIIRLVKKRLKICSFKCLTKHIGREPKVSVKKLHVVDKNNEIPKNLCTQR